MAKKHWKENTPDILNRFNTKLSTLDVFDAETINSCIKGFLEENELGMGQVMTAMRLVLVGSAMGPGVTDIMAIIGKEEVSRRINNAIETIK